MGTMDGQNFEHAKFDIALQILGQDKPPNWLMWLDCDVLIANQSLSLESLLDAADARNADVVIAEEPSGLESGIILLRGGSAHSFGFMQRASESPWKLFGERSMLVHQMAVDSEIFAERSCMGGSGGPGTGDPDSFTWASNLRTVHQRLLISYSAGYVQQHGAVFWSPGDFAIHFSGCPFSLAP